MACDGGLAERVRTALAGSTGVAERKMFGGLCYLLRGNMFCGVVDDHLMVRVGAEAYQAALAMPHTREMDFTGRPLRGLVYVAPTGIRTKRALAVWLERGMAYARSLPAKSVGRSVPGASRRAGR
jgi:TfoX/Sxy family transcriptional regulator of competence genes